MASSEKKRKHEKYSLERKLEIVRLIENGKKLSHVAEELKIPKSTLLEWFRQHRSNEIPIDGNMLLEKANELATSMETETVSRAWIDRWKARHSVGQAKICGEAGSVAMDVVSDWRNKVLPELLKKYRPKDIFNMDETGLFYRLTTDKTLHFKGKRCHGGKLSKERITVALTANMIGTEKLQPLVIGKFAKPRCFKNVESLPVDYYNNKKA